MEQLSTDKWSLHQRSGEEVILAKMALMVIRPGAAYEIKKSAKWAGGRHATVIELHEASALCHVYKFDQRKYSPTRTDLGKFEVPYSSFVGDEW
jgi:hypothetical protein